MVHRHPMYQSSHNCVMIKIKQINRISTHWVLDIYDQPGLSSCLGPLGGVKNLRVTDPTMTSLAVNWDPADGAVRLYKVFYVPVEGGLEEMVSLCYTCLTSEDKNRSGSWLRGSQLGGWPDKWLHMLNLCKQEQVPTGTTSIILRNLLPDTPYTVSVLPVYPAREGKRQSENGRTCKLLSCKVISGSGGNRVCQQQSFSCSQCLWVEWATWRWQNLPSQLSLSPGILLTAMFRATRWSTFLLMEDWRLW